MACKVIRVASGKHTPYAVTAADCNPYANYDTFLNPDLSGAERAYYYALRMKFASSKVGNNDRCFLFSRGLGLVHSPSGAACV